MSCLKWLIHWTRQLREVSNNNPTYPFHTLKQNETLNEILELVESQQLGKALRSLENYLLANPRQSDMSHLSALRDSFLLMSDYWKQGYDDPKRMEVYHQLLRRLYALTANVQLNWQLANSPYMKMLYQRPRNERMDWDLSTIRTAMESFVSDITLLQLEPEHTRQQKSEELHQQHWNLIRDLFDYILTSHQWRSSLADSILELLLSPTLASTDQQLTVSAITLSAMQSFCFEKFRVLVEVYRQATDERLRQCALVGWVLCANADAAHLYTEMNDLIGQLCQDEKTCNDLAEMQMQLIYCMEADADTNTIQKEILPDIISGSNLKITRQGLAEMDEDSLEEILHPEASEQNMERMEQSMKRMADMQRQGADIYFGGFSQMKRFPFFNEVSNWFMPFYPQHPGISQIWNNARGKKFLKTITRLGAFCDSDKYSFVLAFNQVLNHLPQGMLKMIEEGEATAMPLGGEMNLDEQKQPAFIRRIYLQDLYRFFRLFPSRAEFSNPFTVEDQKGKAPGGIFFCNPLFCQQALANQALTVTRFLMKRRRYTDAIRVLANIPESQHDIHYYIMLGTALQHQPTMAAQPATATECFLRATTLQPDNEQALSGLARAYFGNQEYQKGLDAYRTLMELHPDYQPYQLNASICLLNTDQAEEALRILYKLNYQNPDAQNIHRVLAWALTLNGKYEQADKAYQQLLSSDHPQPSDLLNYGYCLWLSRQVEKAIAMFRQFISAQTVKPVSMEKEFMHGPEHELLQSRGINDVEIQLMLDSLG